MCEVGAVMTGCVRSGWGHDRLCVRWAGSCQLQVRSGPGHDGIQMRCGWGHDLVWVRCVYCHDLSL